MPPAINVNTYPIIIPPAHRFPLLIKQGLHIPPRKCGSLQNIHLISLPPHLCVIKFLVNQVLHQFYNYCTVHFCTSMLSKILLVSASIIAACVERGIKDRRFARLCVCADTASFILLSV